MLFRLHGADDVRSPEAFATTVTTRLAIDALRSARVRRERYVGPWLPEPLVAAGDVVAAGTQLGPDPAEVVVRRESLSMAVLMLMEELGPVERAVYVLREALGLDYARIGEIVERSAAACRQLYSRSRRRLADATPPDADGDGRAPAIARPIEGASAVARFLVGLARRVNPLGVRLDVIEANGGPAVRARDCDGSWLAVMAVQEAHGQVVGLQNQLNPDKLTHLGPVGDLTALLTRGGSCAR